MYQSLEMIIPHTQEPSRFFTFGCLAFALASINAPKITEVRQGSNNGSRCTESGSVISLRTYSSTLK